MVGNCKELISVIVPYHTIDERLYRAIASVRGQSWRPLELILVNDGCEKQLDISKSDLGGMTIVEKVLDINSGPATARNLGIEAAKGHFIAFLDSDDYWLPKKLERQVGCLKKRSNIDKTVVTSGVTVVADNRILYSRYPIFGESVEARERLLKGPFMYLGSTAFFSANLGKQVGGQTRELRIYEDFEWQIRLSVALGVTFVSTNSADVCIERSKRKHPATMLKMNHSALLASVNKLNNLPRKTLYYLKTIYLIDRASSEFYRRNFLKFAYFLTLSFLKFPRKTLLLDRFWVKEKNREDI